jgi:hypothetical protein
MLVTLNIKNESKKDSFLNFLATLDYIEIKSQQNIKKKSSEKKDKFKDFAGLWQDRDITLKDIREKAWK